MRSSVIVLVFAFGFSAGLALTLETRPNEPSHVFHNEILDEQVNSANPEPTEQSRKCEPELDTAESSPTTAAQKVASATATHPTALPQKYRFMVDPEPQRSRTLAEAAAEILQSRDNDLVVSDLESDIRASILRFGPARGVVPEFVHCATAGCVIAGYADPASGFEGCEILAWGFRDDVWPVRSASAGCRERDVSGLRRFVSVIEFDSDIS